MKKIFFALYNCFILTFLVSSCESWINVEPDDRLTEDMVFSSQKGFLQALNGIYAEMNDASVYGGNLSVGIIDVLAQYYDGGPDNTYSYYYYSRYDYTATAVKNTFAAIWAKMYSLISSANIIIEKCNQTSVLSESYRKQIKGEALALRAMLHFDLLRLFGPVASQPSSLDTQPSSLDTQPSVAIPYVTVADQTIQDILPADEVMKHILADLTEASQLLEDADPLLTQESLPQLGDDAGGSQYRLNYFAVQVLLARAYLWNGDKAAALDIATATIDRAQTLFPFTTTAAASGAYPDRMFSSEVLFSLYNTSRINVYRKYFAATLDPRRILSFAGTLDAGRVPELYDSQNDLRYRMWAASAEGDNDLIFNKYEDVTLNDGSTEGYCYMMPLIRLSELYLIAAECESDEEQALSYLNTLRNHRGCPDLHPTTPEELLAAITSEFRKETIGEGQMFYFYKRHAMQNIPNGSAMTGDMNMQLKNYVVPIPDSETDNRLE